MTQYVFKKRLEIGAKNPTDVLDQDGLRSESAHRTEDFREEIALILLRTMLTPEAKGLTRCSCCKQPHVLASPNDMLNILFVYRSRKCSADLGVVAQRFARLFVFFVNGEGRESGLMESERKPACSREEIDIEFRQGVANRPILYTLRRSHIAV